MTRQLMAKTQPSQEQQRLAANLFNLTWSLLTKDERTRADDDRMLHAAHASRFHWGEVGEVVNFVRGEWQCSRVYAVLRRAEPALYHAQRCLDWCEGGEGLEDFDLPYAYEALARAHLLAGNADEAHRYQRLACELGEQIADDEDRELFLRDIESLTGLRRSNS
ncbi:MAG: hypothetical protein ABR521_09420 [Gaiellaceae bacterium]